MVKAHILKRFPRLIMINPIGTNHIFLWKAPVVEKISAVKKADTPKPIQGSPTVTPMLP